MPTAKGLLWRAADAFTGGNLPELAAYLGGKGTYEQRVAKGREILAGDAPKQGALGSVAEGVGTIAPYLMAGGALLKGGQAALTGGRAVVGGVNEVRALANAAPLAAPTLRGVGRAAFVSAPKLAYQAVKAHPFLAAGALGAGWAAKNDYNNVVSPEAEQAAAIVTTPKAVAAPQAAAAQPQAGNGYLSWDEAMGLSRKEFNNIVALKQGVRRVPAKDRLLNTIIEETERANQAIQADPNLPADAKAAAAKKRLERLMGLAGVDPLMMSSDTEQD